MTRRGVKRPAVRVRRELEEYTLGGVFDFYPAVIVLQDRAVVKAELCHGVCAVLAQADAVAKARHTEDHFPT